MTDAPSGPEQAASLAAKPVFFMATLEEAADSKALMAKVRDAGQRPAGPA